MPETLKENPKKDSISLLNMAFDLRLCIYHNLAEADDFVNYRVFRKNCVFSQFTATPPSPTSL